MQPQWLIGAILIKPDIDKIQAWCLGQSGGYLLPNYILLGHFWIGAVAEEKNAKNSTGAGDEKHEKLCKQVSRGSLVWGIRIFNQICNIFSRSCDMIKLQ